MRAAALLPSGPALMFQDRNSCTQVRGWIVEEFDHEGMLFQNLLDNAALNTATAAMDHAHLVKACRMSLENVFLDDRRDVARGEGVKIERPFDWYPQRIVRHDRLRLLFVPDRHFSLDSAANGEIARYGHPPRLTRGHEVIEDLVGDILVEDAFIAELDEVVLERFQLDAEPVGHVIDANLSKVGQTGFGADRRELRAADEHLVISMGLGIGKGLQGSA